MDRVRLGKERPGLLALRRAEKKLVTGRLVPPERLLAQRHPGVLRIPVFRIAGKSDEHSDPDDGRDQEQAAAQKPEHARLAHPLGGKVRAISEMLEAHPRDAEQRHGSNAVGQQMAPRDDDPAAVEPHGEQVARIEKCDVWDIMLPQPEVAPEKQTRDEREPVARERNRHGKGDDENAGHDLQPEFGPGEAPRVRAIDRCAREPVEKQRAREIDQRHQRDDGECGGHFRHKNPGARNWQAIEEAERPLRAFIDQHAGADHQAEDQGDHDGAAAMLGEPVRGIEPLFVGHLRGEHVEDGKRVNAHDAERHGTQSAEFLGDEGAHHGGGG